MDMKHIEVLALDLDGTTLNSNHEVSQRTIRAVQAAREQGIRIVLATGRMYQTAQHIGKQLRLGDVPMILFSGGLIQLLDSQQKLWEETVPLEAMQVAFTMAREGGFHIQAYVNDHLLLHHRNEVGYQYMMQTKARVEYIGDRLYEVQELANKLIIIDEPERLDSFQQQMAATCADIVDMVRSERRFLEVIHKGVSKGRALVQLCQQWGVPMEQVVAIGNADNDVSMLQAAGLGVAVANAEPAPLAVAQVVTASNDDDGVAQFIEQHIL